MDISTLVYFGGEVWELFDIQTGKFKFTIFSAPKWQIFLKFLQRLFEVMIASTDAVIDMSSKYPIQTFGVIGVP